MVYQQYVAAPQVRFALSAGSEHEGRAIATCAIVAGEPSAIGMRIGGEITDARAYFQPLALAR